MNMVLQKIGDFVDYVPVDPIAAQSPSAHWHVVQIMSGSETAVAAALKRYKFGIYYPRLRKMKAVPRKMLSAKQRKNGAIVKRPKIEALLPGYMFVHFDLTNSHWHDLFGLIGVRGIWCKGNIPYRVPDALIQAWLDTEVDGAIPGDQTVGALFPFEVGENVRVSSGPFASFPAVVERLPAGYNPTDIIEELDESMRVTLLVNIFGRETPVELSLGEFEKV